MPKITTSNGFLDLGKYVIFLAVEEHTAKEGHFTGLLLYHREELCRVMYPFYFYCLLSEGEPSANNMDIKKAQAQSISPVRPATASNHLWIEVCAMKRSSNDD